MRFSIGIDIRILMKYNLKSSQSQSFKLYNYKHSVYSIVCDLPKLRKDLAI